MGNNSIIHYETKIAIPFVGVVFLASLFLVCISYFIKFDLSWLGVLSWIVVIFGALFFVLWVLDKIFGWSIF